MPPPATLDDLVLRIERERTIAAPADVVFAAEFEQEAATTRRLLENAPESTYGWRPHEKGKSVAELCDHIASVYAGMPTVLGGEGFDISERPEPGPPPATRAELLERLDGALVSCREWLSGLGAGPIRGTSGSSTFSPTASGTAGSRPEAARPLDADHRRDR